MMSLPAHLSTRFVLGATAAAVTVAAGGVAIRHAAAAEKPTDVQIVGHVYQPMRLPVTDERVASLKVAEGYDIAIWAEGLGKPRMLMTTDDGKVYVSRREPGDLLLLQDKDGDGKADGKPQTIAEKQHLHGLAQRDGKLYFYTVHDVYEAAMKKDGTIGEATKIIDHLPDGGQHANRTMMFGPDGKLYLSVGSTCNACDEPNKENATMLVADPANGWKRQTFATGLRNTIGFDFHPDTEALWGFDHGIDWLGDNEGKEELNLIEEGKQYGWPFVYADSKINPADEPKEMSSQEWAEKSTEPALLHTAHAAPMQMIFLKGNGVPAEYRHDALVAMHGSWNRKPPSGHEVVRVTFDDKGQPTGIEPFVTGFLVQQDGSDDYARFGRPCGLAQLPDGSILLSDDYNGVIYRISRSERAQ